MGVFGRVFGKHGKQWNRNLRNKWDQAKVAGKKMAKKAVTEGKEIGKEAAKSAMEVAKTKGKEMVKEQVDSVMSGKGVDFKKVKSQGSSLFTESAKAAFDTSKQTAIQRGIGGYDTGLERFGIDKISNLKVNSFGDLKKNVPWNKVQDNLRGQVSKAFVNTMDQKMSGWTKQGHAILAPRIGDWGAEKVIGIGTTAVNSFLHGDRGTNSAKHDLKNYVLDTSKEAFEKGKQYLTGETQIRSFKRKASVLSGEIGKKVLFEAERLAKRAKIELSPEELEAAEEMVKGNIA